MDLIKRDRSVLKRVVNSLFTFGDVCEKLKGIEAGMGNIYCPFHENYNSPAAKIYYDENNDYLILHCFSEGRNFTTFDYIERILCDRNKEFQSVEDFLEKKLTKPVFETTYNEFFKSRGAIQESLMQKKIDYINSVYNDTENVTDYIEALYTERATNE